LTKNPTKLTIKCGHLKALINLVPKYNDYEPNGFQVFMFELTKVFFGKKSFSILNILFLPIFKYIFPSVGKTKNVIIFETINHFLKKKHAILLLSLVIHMSKTLKHIKIFLAHVLSRLLRQLKQESIFKNLFGVREVARRPLWNETRFCERAIATSRIIKNEMSQYVQ
jgi:hypothetical protein